MKALILSDSHGRVGNMIEAMENERDIDLVVFAGDVHRDIEEFMLIYPRVCVAEVIGNNDFFEKSVPEDRVFDLGGKKLFVTHGHKYGVKYSKAKLIREAKKAGADICIYGHTHARDYEETEDMIIINPGTASRGYCVLRISGDKTETEFKNF